MPERSMPSQARTVSSSTCRPARRHRRHLTMCFGPRGCGRAGLRADTQEAGIAERGPGNAIAHECNGKIVAGIGPSSRSAEAEMAEAVRDDAAGGRGEVVAEAPPHRKADDDVDAARGRAGRAPQSFVREKAFTVEYASAGDCRVHAGERPGGEAAVDRGDRG